MPTRSYRSLAILALALTFGGCKRNPPAPLVDSLEVRDGESIAEPSIGGDPSRQPRVTFRIDAVYPDAKPTQAPPWHAPGGTWTFFDAHLDGGASFGFGLQVGPATASSFSFGKAMLTVPSAVDGAKIVDRFATVFHAKPPPGAPAQPLRFVPISVAVLGRGQARRASSGFGGTGGWTATKLFLQRPGLEAEVFFNFDLEDKRGEFAEKDRDYADDMVAFLARELRDGPRPARSPANDPRVSASGPKLEGWRSFGPPKAKPIGFEANGKRLLYSVTDGGKTRVVSASLDGAADETALVQVDHDLGRIVCAPRTADPCVVEEQTPKTPGESSSEDPRVFHLVQRARKTSRLLEGPWGDHGDLFSSEAVSPDGAWVAMAQWKPRAKGTGNFEIVHFAPVAGGAPVASDLGEDSIELVGWTGSGAAMRAVVQRGSKWSKPARLSWVLVDPKTGGTTDLPAPPVGLVADRAVSPDGRRRVTCDGQSIVVSEVAAKTDRRFSIFEEDRHAFKDDECVEWSSARYLSYNAGRPAFLDADTLTLSYPFEEGAEPPALRYDPGFKVAMSSSSDGIRVARVVTAAAPSR